MIRRKYLCSSCLIRSSRFLRIRFWLSACKFPPCTVSWLSPLSLLTYPPITLYFLYPLSPYHLILIGPISSCSPCCCCWCWCLFASSCLSSCKGITLEILDQSRPCYRPSHCHCHSSSSWSLSCYVWSALFWPVGFDTHLPHDFRPSGVSVLPLAPGFDPCWVGRFYNFLFIAGLLTWDSCRGLSAPDWRWLPRFLSRQRLEEPGGNLIILVFIWWSS